MKSILLLRTPVHIDSWYNESWSVNCVGKLWFISPTSYFTLENTKLVQLPKWKPHALISLYTKNSCPNRPCTGWHWQDFSSIKLVYICRKLIHVLSQRPMISFQPVKVFLQNKLINRMHQINAAARNVLDSIHWHSCTTADDLWGVPNWQALEELYCSKSTHNSKFYAALICS